MITHRARAGEWQPDDPAESLRGWSRSNRQGEPRQPRTIRVVVVDGHDLIRAGISSLIASDPGYEVVGEASDAAEAIEVVKRLAPDVVLMDVLLPDIGGIEATRRMCNPGVGTAIVLFATECDTETLMAALRAGAHGFVLKDVERGELLSVIRRVLTGSHAIESTLATELLRHMAEDVAQRPASRPEPLTPREVEVLRLISTGSTNPQIASRLICAVGTVKVHVEHIIAKLGATDRTQAAVLAIEMGLINPEASGERDQNLS